MSIFEHLSKPEYVHVLLNPLPVYGLSVSVVSLIIALVLRSRAARISALVLVMLTAASAWPVYEYGEAGYDRVKAMVDEEGDKWLEEHMRRGQQLIYVFYFVAVLSASAFVAEFALQKAVVPLAIATLIVAVANLCVGAYIAQAGGRVRHKEFRVETPPEPNTETTSDKRESFLSGHALLGR